MMYYHEIVLLVSTLMFPGSLAAPTLQHSLQENENRQAKNLFFDYIQPEIDYEGYSVENNDYVAMAIDENDLSRTIPSRKRVRPQYDSPIYYIRLPPQPYMFVPGLGYVSQPTPNPMSQFLNVPVSFIANGKPSGIYQWSGGIEIPSVASSPPPTPKPKPVKKPSKSDSTIHRLPGKFTFNGRPEDIFVLRDSYNSLYSDVLQNLYP